MLSIAEYHVIKLKCNRGTVTQFYLLNVILQRHVALEPAAAVGGAHTQLTSNAEELLCFVALSTAISLPLSQTLISS